MPMHFSARRPTRPARSLVNLAGNTYRVVRSMQLPSLSEAIALFGLKLTYLASLPFNS